MEDFFKKLGGDKKNSNNGGIKNPFANVKLGGGKKVKKFSGQGQTLGGNEPGNIINIRLPHPGSLGVKVEKTNRGGAIVASVVPSTQASDAGLRRGDIICIPRTEGKEEMLFDQFMALAKSDRRPLIFDIRRIHGMEQAKPMNSSSLANKSKINSKLFSKKKVENPSSANAQVRRQAVITAAEARDRAHKAKTKPISKVSTATTVDPTKFLSTSERNRLKLKEKERLEEMQKQGPQSEESRVAVMEAKRGEAQTAQKLGFNLYETKRVTGGRAKNASVDMKHGSIDASNTDQNNNIASGGERGSGSRTADAGRGNTASRQNPLNTNTIPAIQEPALIPSTTDDNINSDSIDESFDEVYSILLSSSDKNLNKSISTMHKLIVNATTKGQTGEEQDGSKFRRVRLSNEKIKEFIVDVHGALDLMMLFGFHLQEIDNETLLVYPFGYAGPSWMEKALKRMKEYA